MSILRRRSKEPTQRPTPPMFASFRERAMWRRANNIVVVGPSEPPSLPKASTRSDRVRDQKHLSQIEREHREVVEAELLAIDAHCKFIEKLGVGAGSYADQERRAELHQLRALHVMLKDDMAAGPIARDRGGRPINEHVRAFIRVRARELAEQLWFSAGRAEAEGDHRRARHERRDALRARMIAEYEMGWRPSLPGYGLSAWN